MSTLTDPDAIQPFGQPAPVVRFFGWGTLFVLAAFLINNILVSWLDFPGIGSIVAGGADPRAFVVVALYLVALAGAVVYVWYTGNTALRWDARAITAFNAYLIRGCFFAVLFVGLADAAVAFLRIESLFGTFLPEDTAREFNRVQFLAPTIHGPLILAGFIVAIFSRTLGFQWLALMIVAAELLIVISRFVFSYEQALMGDLVRYWYAALFLFASAYTLLEEGHVRVDVLYAGFSRPTKGKVNAFGAIMFGMVTCWCVLIMGMGSPQAIINAPVRNFEISQASTAGMYVKYQMAAFLGIFAVTMLIQFVAYLFEAVADRRGEPGHKDHDGASAS
ncbi:MAG: permease [Rhodobacteraceae bacterium]|nr:permease [Paracoccaceae bacterium]